MGELDTGAVDRPGFGCCRALRAGCADELCGVHRQACRDWGIGGIWLEVLWFGSPVVAAVVIFVSFFTAKRRYGIVVPLCGWALLAADVGLLALFGQP